jgi:uncharacterized protein
MKRVATMRSLELSRKRAELPFPTDPAQEPLCVVVVADTHSKPHERAHGLIAALRPHAILHAGDVGDLTVLDDLAAIAPVFAVRGNIDERMSDVPDVLVLDIVTGSTARLSILLFHIGLAGPRVRADAARLFREEKASLLVCGHSHVPFLGLDRGIPVFNPGSIGPRRFLLPIVFGVIEVPRIGSVRMHHVSCETGVRWMP